MVPKYHNILWLTNYYTVWHINNSSKYMLVIHSLEKQQCWGGGENWIKNKTKKLLVYKHSVSTPTFLFMLLTLLHLSLGICSIWLWRCICFFMLQALHVQMSSTCLLKAMIWQSHLLHYICLWLKNMYCSYNSSSLKFCEKAEKQNACLVF